MYLEGGCEYCIEARKRLIALKRSEGERRRERAMLQARPTSERTNVPQISESALRELRRTRPLAGERPRFRGGRPP
jgi:hypothetical protein